MHNNDVIKPLHDANISQGIPQLQLLVVAVDIAIQKLAAENHLLNLET